jgi:hypothetical protein
MFCRLKPEYREAILAEKAAQTTRATTVTTISDTESLGTTSQTYLSLPPNCNMFCRLKPEYREAILAEKAAQTTISTTVTTATDIGTTAKTYLSLPPNCNMFCRLKPEYR